MITLIHHSFTLLKSLRFALFASVLHASFLLAQATDKGGSRDHPILKRYGSSSVFQYSVKEFADYNLSLSKRRATAVAAELSSRYGVGANRLHPEGAGAMAPVASNHTDAGRAKNRRVELVGE